MATLEGGGWVDFSLLNGVCVSEFLAGPEGGGGKTIYEGGGVEMIECQGKEGSGCVWYILLIGDCAVN